MSWDKDGYWILKREKYSVGLTITETVDQQVPSVYNRISKIVSLIYFSDKL